MSITEASFHILVAPFWALLLRLPSARVQVARRGQPKNCTPWSYEPPCLFSGKDAVYFSTALILYRDRVTEWHESDMCRFHQETPEASKDPEASLIVKLRTTSGALEEG